ncbi:MAG: fluoride efflux transporter CrcB [Myxococcales bacterium]|nr:fluoride efflux transporter CrcB [Myxococcales bacterium]
MTLTLWLAVAAGGALGAVSRFGVALWLGADAAAGDLPWATLLVNVVGTLILATLAYLSLSESTLALSRTWNAALGTGFCGALTTFSTFSVETILLARAGHVGVAVAYLALNLVICLAGAAIVLRAFSW